MGVSLAPISGVVHHPYNLWIWRLRHCGFPSVFNCRIGRRPSALEVQPHRHVLVTPVDYVELRALAIARQDIEGRVERSEGFGLGGRVLRLWPFRWPAHEPQVLPPEPKQNPAPEVGHYVDILF
ncbi:MAG: hypothetical protein MI923_15185 [Phycisphaerales bacterium]|nr:hypothetical protein [Phycisphaerales bacterium]